MGHYALYHIIFIIIIIIIIISDTNKFLYNSIYFIVAGVPYCVSVAAVNRAGQGSITTLTNFTKELGMYAIIMSCSVANYY